MFFKKSKQDEEFEKKHGKQAKAVEKMTSHHRSLCDYLEHLKRGGDNPKMRIIQ